MVERYNADLANGLGNLASRVTAMVERYRDGVLPGAGPAGDAEVAVQDAAVQAHADAKAALYELAYERALAGIWRLVGAANGYLSERRPWDLARAGDDLALDTVLYTGAEALRIAALLAAPWLTKAAPALWTALGAPGELAEARLPEALAWGGLPRGARVQRLGALFPRLDAEGNVVQRAG
jgi:methionyl-tRNA synthetase